MCLWLELSGFKPVMRGLCLGSLSGFQDVCWALWGDAANCLFDLDTGDLECPVLWVKQAK